MYENLTTKTSLLWLNMNIIPVTGEHPLDPQNR